MKNVDENRRDTYDQISTSLQESSIFTMLEDDLKQLTPVRASNLKDFFFVLSNKESDRCFVILPGWIEN